MKTSRIFRIFMMGLDTIVLFLLRLVRPFTKLIPGGDGRGTSPSRLVRRWEKEVDGAPAESFSRSEPISFAPDETYAETDGVFTFRGDHTRGGGAFGAIPSGTNKLSESWRVPTGKLKKHYGKGYWTGSGWTGQPLIARWDADMLAKMNVYDEKKKKDGLVEVIYSTMDGNVYFLDLDDGTPTRDVLHVGLPFKGSGALDPRIDRPILYLGPGDGGPNEGEYARALAYSLIDCTLLFEFGGEDPFAERIFHGYDSSPLVHKETDTLIEPGENGIFYTMKLNSRMEDGKLVCHPSERVKVRYQSTRSSEERFWLGMEDSAVMLGSDMIIADNGGNLFSIDLNTMELNWVQDVSDDTNGSPVLSVEGGRPYIYIATSLHWQAGRFFKLGNVPIFKIDAQTGEYVWRRTYFCNTIAGISGGVQATPAVGRDGSDIENLVIFPVARTPQVRSGRLVALDKASGKIVWKTRLDRYAWSSPLALYDKDGVSRLIACDSVGNIYLIAGATGKILDKICPDGNNIEATPAAFDDMVVVGTRGQKILGLRVCKAQ